MSPMIGLRIATAIGPTSLITVGPGLATSLGDGRRITTVAGSGTEILGPGGRVLSAASTVRSGRLRTSRSGDGAVALVSDLALAVGEVLAGSRLDRVTISIRGGADIAAASAGSDAEAGTAVVMADSVRCRPATASRTSPTFITSTSGVVFRRSVQGASVRAASRQWLRRVSRSAERA